MSTEMMPLHVQVERDVFCFILLTITNLQYHANSCRYSDRRLLTFVNFMKPFLNGQSLRGDFFKICQHSMFFYLDHTKSITALISCYLISIDDCLRTSMKNANNNVIKRQ